MKKYIIGGFLLLAVGFAVFLVKTSFVPLAQSTSNEPYEYYYNENTDQEGTPLPGTANSKTSMPLDTNPSSITVLVNRTYLLPTTYVPEDLIEPNVKFDFSYSSDKRKLRKIAANALEKLFQRAEKQGITFYGVSGYRSYARQEQIYNNNVATRGVEATDAVSAKPGSSEHQTGLAIDISAQSVGCRLDQELGNTIEGQWLAQNAHKFGYIIRYPKGKDKITGYTYEPWHIRFVGKALAKKLYSSGLTLEEYYGCSSAISNSDSMSGVDVEDADDVKYKTPKPRKTFRPTATPKASATPKPTKKPKKTPKPTKKPKKTETPKPTAKPIVTSTPEVPSATHAPAKTSEPIAPTKQPEPTSPPIETSEPTETANP